MKAAKREAFNPVTLTMILETPEECSDFYNLVNHTDVTNLIPNIDCDVLRNLLAKHFDKESFDKFAEGLK